MNITNEEVKKLAKMSRIAVNDEEVIRLCEQVTSVLNYAARVQEIARDVAELEEIHDSRMREDVAGVNNASALLEQAPERQENLFVVPKIL